MLFLMSFNWPDCVRLPVTSTACVFEFCIWRLFYRLQSFHRRVAESEAYVFLPLNVQSRGDKMKIPHSSLLCLFHHFTVLALNKMTFPNLTQPGCQRKINIRLSKQYTRCSTALQTWRKTGAYFGMVHSDDWLHHVASIPAIDKGVELIIIGSTLFRVIATFIRDNADPSRAASYVFFMNTRRPSTRRPSTRRPSTP
jgi:hypothetical protein